LPWQLPLARKWLPAIDRLGFFAYPLMINFAVRGIKQVHNG